MEKCPEFQLFCHPGDSVGLVTIQFLKPTKIFVKYNECADINENIPYDVVILILTGNNTHASASGF